MPASARPPAVDEIARECGYLPLGVALAGKMIASFGQGWETEVPALLRESQAEVLPSAEDHVMNVSLSTIRGPQAEHVRQLFKWMALFQEDAVIPIRAIISMVESQDGSRRGDGARSQSASHLEHGPPANQLGLLEQKARERYAGGPHAAPKDRPRFEQSRHLVDEFAQH